MKDIVQTPAAPAAIGAYSQAVRLDGFLFISGQIPLDPATGELITGGGEPPIRRAFENLAAICHAGGATLDDIVKLSVYLTDLAEFALVNEVMGDLFAKPYPARAVLGVKSLPKNATIEVEAFVCLP